MKPAKQRIIYNNYNLWEEYHEEAFEALTQDYDPEEITENMIWDEIYQLDHMNWEDEKERLTAFFENRACLLIGCVGRWNGNFSAGTVFYDFRKMFYMAAKDCDYWKIWDENGHFYMKCSHHDGTNIFEIKEITDKGISLLDNWKYNYNDPRTEEEIHSTIFNNNFYSRLLHFAHTVFGCRKTEVTRNA